MNPVRNTQFEAEAFFVDTQVVNPTHAVSAGHTFDLGDIEIGVLATPGHTPFNLSVYNQRDDVLFCGDCIVRTYIPNLEAGTVSDWQDWLKSLDAIAALSPGIILPGHGNIIRGAEAIIEINRTRKIIEAAIEHRRAPTKA